MRNVELVEACLGWALCLNAFTAGGALFMLHTSRATFSLSENIFIESGGRVVFLIAVLAEAFAIPNAGEAWPEILTDQAIYAGLFKP